MEYAAYNLIQAVYEYTHQRNETNRERLAALYYLFIDLCEQQLRCKLRRKQIIVQVFMQFTTTTLWIVSTVKAMKEGDYQLAESNARQLMSIMEGGLTLCTE